MLTADRPRITITLEHDGDALRVTAVLEAIGFRVTRAMPSATEGERRAYAVRLLDARHRLTGREAKALDGVLAGFEGKALADYMKASKPTANLARNGVLVKLGVDDDAGVRRSAAECVEPIGWAMVCCPPPASPSRFPLETPPVFEHRHDESEGSAASPRRPSVLDPTTWRDQPVLGSTSWGHRVTVGKRDDDRPMERRLEQALEVDGECRRCRLPVCVCGRP